MRLDNKVALITGGGTGIGRETARLFAAEGARVLIFGRRKEPLEKTVADIGPSALPVTGDITREDDVQRLLKTALEAHGRVDIVVNNAGIFRPGALDEVGDDDFDEMMNINLRGPFLLTRAALKVMLPQGSGNLIFINSILGQVAVPGASSYCASKGALLQLARAVAVEYGGRGIRANSVAPGLIETDMAAGLLADKEWADAIRKEYPIGHFGAAGDVARACLYLAGDESAFVTGAVLPVDGGYTAH
jgi:NAD(P)-dependent dehydrogenase (short-subunit alcohol dehydrogenase family)